MTFEQEIREGRCDELRCQAKAVAKGIKVLRKSAKIGRREMSEQMAVGETGLRRIENGWRHAEYEHLRIIAKTLRIPSVTDLVILATTHTPLSKPKAAP